MGSESLKYNRNEVEIRHDNMNHSFELNELPNESLTRELIMTTLYEYNRELDIIPRTYGRTSKLVGINDGIKDIFTRIPQTGLIFLRPLDFKDINTLKETISLIREKNPSAIIAVDFEGGYVKSLTIPKKILKKYNFPEKILDLKKQEESEYIKRHGIIPKNLGQFPSAEFLGFKYKALFLYKNKAKERNEFKKMMFEYGRAIGNIYASYGINMILGPSLDVSNSSIGTSDETDFSKNDRSYSDISGIVSDLGNSFIKGTIEVGGFISVPKHFVGVGLTDGNTDIESVKNKKLNNGVILPFKEYLDLHEIQKMTKDQAFQKLIRLENNEKGNIRINRAIKSLEKRLENSKNKTPPIIMMGNNDNNFYDNGIPTSLSKKSIYVVKKRLSTTNSKHFGGLGDNGIIISDDLNTGSIRNFVNKSGDSLISETASLALNSGIDILLFGDTDISDIIKGSSGISREKLISSAKKILDLKVTLGIYIKVKNKYILNPKMYNPTDKLIEEDASNSRVWPFLEDLDYEYKQEKGKINHISIVHQLTNNLKNLILNGCRINPGNILKTICSIHPKMYNSYISPNEKLLRKKLIVVDKGNQQLYTYDLETREKIDEIDIGIGKGTKALDYTHDKKVSGDKKTPVGYYKVVQKKDPKIIKATIDNKLYNEYGGDNGGMLVLAGPWHPQIAIHGTNKESIGPVSSGCVRVNNKIINKMLDTIPLGSIVVITN